MNYASGLAPLEGERHAVRASRLSFCLTIDDYREDQGYIDPNALAMMEAIDSESIEDLKDVAKCAIDTMPDVSCAAIAHALGLKLHSVIAMSNGRHNKAKRKGISKGIELAEVTREELIENYRAQWAQ